MPLIGIDLGTTFIKGAVLDLDTCRIHHIQRVPFPKPLSNLPPLFCEYDPLSILHVTRQMLEELADQARPCKGLVMCSQMHSLVIVDVEVRPQTTLTTWQDQRDLTLHPSGRTYFDIMVEQLGERRIRELGNELRPGIPAGVLFWMSQQGKSLAGLCPLSLPDFIISHLCRSQPCTDVTNAAAYGTFNIERLDWHAEVLELLGIAQLQWPKIRPQGSLVGFTQIGQQEIPCYLPVGDFQCALAGAFVQDNELAINISTGSQVALLRAYPQLGEYQTRPFFDGRFLIGLMNIPAGRALNLLVKLLSELAESQGLTLNDPWPYILQQAERVQSSEIRVDLAFFKSSCGDRGHITNIHESEMTIGHLFRAAFESMADSYYVCAQRLSPEREWHNVVLSGGLAHKSPLLRRLIQERFQVPCRLCPETEDTLLGLLALGLAFSGRAASVNDAITLLKSAMSSQN